MNLLDALITVWNSAIRSNRQAPALERDELLEVKTAALELSAEVDSYLSYKKEIEAENAKLRAEVEALRKERDRIRSVALELACEEVIYQREQAYVDLEADIDAAMKSTETKN